MTTPGWKQRPEVGGRAAVKLIHAVTRLGGRSLGRLVLPPIALYFYLRRGAERRASRDYLTRVLGRPARAVEVIRHIGTFAATILDRVFLLSESTRRFDVSVHGLDGLHAQLDQGRGLLLFGSHLGSFEVLRVLARKRPETVIRVVLDKAHSPAVTQLLEDLNPEVAATVIDAGQEGMAIMLEIQQAAQQGALIALLVDRTQPGEPAARVPFLGAPADFPVSPWLIAAVLRLPVSLAFGLYRGGNRYDLLFEPFSDGVVIPRNARATAVPALIARYAARLEHHVRRAPYNWFNFYDFWEQGDRHDSTPSASPRGAIDDGTRDGHAAPGAGMQPDGAIRSGPDGA
ncbi:MAG TPA: acyltransferase [Luteimonas sp.]|nr:acyltransferase [Luteimonas sp.]